MDIEKDDNSPKLVDDIIRAYPKENKGNEGTQKNPFDLSFLNHQFPFLLRRISTLTVTPLFPVLSEETTRLGFRDYFRLHNLASSDRKHRPRIHRLGHGSGHRS